MILQVAVDGNLRPDQMGARRCLCSPVWKTLIGLVVVVGSRIMRHYKKNLKEKGYGDAVPHIVFWLLDPYETGYGAVLLLGMSLEAFSPAIDDGFCTMIGEGSGAGFDGGWSINHSMISRSN
ncbi:hypothetical protein Pyn_39641 [Prunus yedoensis var. nudiflora]|uniref:Uncharacterized protein n=1 Tax=Prunus yedoensis var. nudiflora TaxID=2094558 RepID=A0A314ZHM8_PRUYE|nr:hypothetical protein Pyn_39641 [Prunus yedoensis var. nudiflora]